MTVKEVVYCCKCLCKVVIELSSMNAHALGVTLYRDITAAERACRLALAPKEGVPELSLEV